MNIKRFIAVLLTVLMALAVLPAASLAERAGEAVHEKAMLSKLSSVWQELEAVEAEALASGAEPGEVVMAVYRAALQLRLVDEKSINSVTHKGFFFKVSGMECCYDYVARNTKHVSSVTDDMLSAVSSAVPAKNGPTNMNVLLVGPYYGEDSNFTNQYRNEANSIAATTGGDMVELAHYAATGPAIAEAAADSGVIIYDSHGTASGTSSYLCLTTNSGITSEDYSNGWAVNAGSAAYIDGRYVQHHIPNELPNSIVWMAICEGMKLSGRGTTGYALLEAGAGCVYGYSQSVSFTGDYRYEAHFWNNMKNNNMTVAEAFNAMTAALGNWDPAYPSPSGSAWPIVMSPDDPFPSNPDSHQTVYCDWSLMGGDIEPVDIEGWSLSESAIELYATSTVSVKFERIPDNANNYELTWHSLDRNVATVSGNNRRVNITGVGEGETEIYCEVVAGGEVLGRAYCAVTVLHFPTLDEAANAEGGMLTFTSPSTNYPWVAGFADGRAVAKSGNAGIDSSTSTMQLVLDMQAGEKLRFDWKVSCEDYYDTLSFYVNNSKYGSSITNVTDWETVTYTATTAGTYTFQWRFVKDYSVGSGDDCGYVDNVVYIANFLSGDVNEDGVVGSEDALLILRYSLNLIGLSAAQLQRADVNGDGVVNSADATIILRSALGY